VFFDQIKDILGSQVTEFSHSQPGYIYIELQYKGNKIEVDYDGIEVGGIFTPVMGATFVLSIDLGSDLELEILPKHFLDRMFDVEAGVPLISSTKKFKVQIGKEDFVVNTNQETLAKNFLASLKVVQLVEDYGISFFKVSNGELKVCLHDLPDQELKELEVNPSLFTGYLDTTAYLASALK
jgi:hypothetical protein